MDESGAKPSHVIVSRTLAYKMAAVYAKFALGYKPGSRKYKEAMLELTKVHMIDVQIKTKT